MASEPQNNTRTAAVTIAAPTNACRQNSKERQARQRRRNDRNRDLFVGYKDHQQHRQNPARKKRSCRRERRLQRICPVQVDYTELVACMRTQCVVCH